MEALVPSFGRKEDREESFPKWLIISKVSKEGEFGSNGKGNQ